MTNSTYFFTLSLRINESNEFIHLVEQLPMLSRFFSLHGLVIYVEGSFKTLLKPCNLRTIQVNGKTGTMRMSFKFLCFSQEMVFNNFYSGAWISWQP